VLWRRRGGAEEAGRGSEAAAGMLRRGFAPKPGMPGNRLHVVELPVDGSEFSCGVKVSLLRKMEFLPRGLIPDLGAPTSLARFGIVLK
jgi:hypothetical protein